MATSRPRRLPDKWDPDCLERFDRMEYDHLADFGLTPDEIVRRLGWSLQNLTRRSQRYTDEKKASTV